MREKWEKGKPFEVMFWQSWLRHHASEYNVSSPLRDYFRPLIGDKEAVTIADLGAGALSTIGDQHPICARVRIEASDILADDYVQLWEKLGMSPRIPVQRQDMEHLTYLDNHFDIVHCSNALDHCCDPRAALNEMIRVCKPGGWIYLRHFQNVGRLERYAGLHLWNIMVNDDHDAVFWNREQRFLLWNVAKGFRTELKEDDLPGYPFVVSVMQK